MTEHKIRIVIAKPGLDGHDVGAKIVSRALMEKGMEVIYTGLRKSPEEIAQIALDEGVDVVGLSILSGSHLPLTKKVKEELAARELASLPVIVGGNIPEKDHAELRKMGVAGIFPTGSDFDEIARFLIESL